MAEGILQAFALSTSIKLQKKKIGSLFSQAKIVENYHWEIISMCEGFRHGAVESSLTEWGTQKHFLMMKCGDILERMIQLRKEKHEKRLLFYEGALAKYASSLNGEDLSNVQYVAIQVNDRVLRQWEALKNHKAALNLFRFREDKIAANESFFKQRLEALNSQLEDQLFFHKRWTQISENLAKP
jgi:hypothetical protein